MHEIFNLIDFLLVKVNFFVCLYNHHKLTEYSII